MLDIMHKANFMKCHADAKLCTLSSFIKHLSLCTLEHVFSFVWISERTSWTEITHSVQVDTPSIQITGVFFRKCLEMKPVPEMLH